MDDLDPMREIGIRFEWSTELYRAIGRFVVSFESTCNSTRRAIAMLVWDDPYTSGTPIQIILGDVPAAGLRDRFQGLLAHLDWVDASDRPVFDDVCKRFTKLIRERNTVVH